LPPDRSETECRCSIYPWRLGKEEKKKSGHFMPWTQKEKRGQRRRSSTASRVAARDSGGKRKKKEKEGGIEVKEKGKTSTLSEKKKDK